MVRDRAISLVTHSAMLFMALVTTADEYKVVWSIDRRHFQRP